MRCAGVAAPESRVAGRVFQAEAGLVTLGHSTARGHFKQVIVTEGVHAVIVPGNEREGEEGVSV